jgi:(p)ppGpp synthase/HD superfamily hydrolase
MKNWSIDTLQDVWQLATELHDGQKYGGPRQGQQIEYINHIGSVVFEVMAALQQTQEMNAELALTCAILHDTLEDTGITLEEIRSQFGTAVADGVLALTKDAEIADKNEKMLDSLTRIQQQPHEIWAVKLADRICNLYAPPFYWSNEKKQAYLEESKLIFAALKDGNVYLANRLALKIQEYQRFIV